MEFVPADAELYFAELVQELTVEWDPRNVVWRNLTLVHAHSPDEAYDKALRLGQAGDTDYLNPSGKQVAIRFQGISSLDVIHDALEDGAELTFHAETASRQSDF